MKIEELHKIIKLKHKKRVTEIEEYPCFLGFGPAYKEFFITKGELTISIIQVGKKKCFEFWIQNTVEGDSCVISTKMDGSKAIDLVNLIM